MTRISILVQKIFINTSGKQELSRSQPVFLCYFCIKSLDMSLDESRSISNEL